MGDIPTDVPWTVRWDTQFEQDVTDRKASGSFEQYKKQILRIVEEPVRTGRYKSENYKGLKTAHVSGQPQDIICFELTPGINDPNQREAIEEVYFYFIDSWDKYGSALTNRTPAEMEHRFVLRLPYLDQGYDVEAVKHDVFRLANEVAGLNIDSVDWEPEYLEISGEAEPEIRESLEEQVPDAVDIEYDEPSPF